MCYVLPSQSPALTVRDPFYQEKTADRDSLRLRIAAPPELLRLIVPKGYISVDGASLTVVDVVQPVAPGAPGTFSIMLIAYTQQRITLPRKSIGARVNLEASVWTRLSLLLSNSASVFRHSLPPLCRLMLSASI